MKLTPPSSTTLRAQNPTFEGPIRTLKKSDKAIRKLPPNQKFLEYAGDKKKKKVTSEGDERVLAAGLVRRLDCVHMLLVIATAHSLILYL